MKLFISQGGCGTHGLNQHGWLGNNFTSTVNGCEYNGHGRDPNNILFMNMGVPIEGKKTPFEEGMKVFYILANPYDYLIYCFRRESDTPGFNLAHHWQTGCDHEYFRTNSGITLLDYLQDPYDAIQYQEHADGYLNNIDRKYEMFFIKYETLQDVDVMRKVKKFWELPDSYPDFSFRKRKSNWKDSNQITKDLLKKKYGKVMEWYENLPDYAILGPNDVV